MADAVVGETVSEPGGAGRRGGVLQVGALRESLTTRLHAAFDVLTLASLAPEGKAELGEDAGDIRVVVTGHAGANRELIEALPALRAIVCSGAGFEHVDVQAAIDHGVGVSNTADVLADSVADAAVGLVIDTMRGLTAADRYVRSGRWPREEAFPLTHRVSGARVGVLGLGQIGRAIARRLAAFDCPIGYHSRSAKPDAAAYSYLASPVELASWADVLVVSVPGDASTNGMVDETVLTALGESGVLVNVSRGSVVDEPTLTHFLENGRLRGAGLDVFANEPHVPDSLMVMENVVLLPHVASGTVETRKSMDQLVLDNVRSCLGGDGLVSPIPGSYDVQKISIRASTAVRDPTAEGRSGG